jgi:hypothetical protein
VDSALNCIKVGDKRVVRREGKAERGQRVESRCYIQNICPVDDAQAILIETAQQHLQIVLPNFGCNRARTPIRQTRQGSKGLCTAPSCACS